MKEIKVREYGWWTYMNLYTYVKKYKETSCNFFKWGGEEVEGESGWG
jgi:hypothetical protein